MATVADELINNSLDDVIVLLEREIERLQLSLETIRLSNHPDRSELIRWHIRTLDERQDALEQMKALLLAAPEPLQISSIAASADLRRRRRSHNRASERRSCAASRVLGSASMTISACGRRQVDRESLIDRDESVGGSWRVSFRSLGASPWVSANGSPGRK